MLSNSFAPGKALTAAVAMALVVLVGLGTWQAQKIGPKNALVQSIEDGLSAEPIELPVHLDDPRTLAYRRLYFRGSAMDVAPIRVFGTNLKGRPGYYLYKPVVREFGRGVIVNFGWVPMELETLPDLPVGDIEVSGVLLLSAEPGSFTPPNDVAGNVWYTADVFDMGAQFNMGAKDHYHFRLFSDHTGDPQTYPQGGQVRVSIPNDHLEYMFTWYGIAAAMLAVFLVYGRKKAMEEGE